MKYFSWLGAFVSVLCIAFILSGCGKTTTPLVVDSSSGQSAAPPTVAQFVAHMVETMGENYGFDAIYLAHEKGYSLAQIAEAGLNNRLGTEGIITDENGVIVTPEPQPTATENLISKVTATADLDMIRDWLKTKGPSISAEGNGLLLLTLLIQGGYSAEQIVEAFLFGYIIQWSEGYSIELYDETGKPVTPALVKDTTTFSQPATDNGGATGGGTATGDGDGCFLTSATILGSWFNPHTNTNASDGSYFPACTYTFNSDETGSRTCELISGTSPFLWDIKCNTVGIDDSSWDVTSPTTMQIISHGTVLVMTKG